MPTFGDDEWKQCPHATMDHALSRGGGRLHLLLASSVVLCLINLLASSNNVSLNQVLMGSSDHEAHPRAGRPLEGRDDERATKRVYWRYDEAGFPNVLLSRSHWLPSIPKTRAIPIHQAENMTYHLAQRKNLTGKSLRIVPGSKGKFRVKDPSYNITNDHRTLYMYNPSVVPMPSLRKTFGDDSISYVATFRLYLGCNCFGPNPERLLMKAGEQINYLGIAVLNQTLGIVHDAVLDINDGPLPENVDYWKAASQPVEDCRIFNVRDSLNLVCNALHFQIRLESKGTTERTESGSYPYVYDIMYGDDLDVVLLEPPKQLIKGKISKNMNVFQYGSNESSSSHTAFLQVYPKPHWYKHLEGTDPAIQAPESQSQASFDTPDIHHTIRASPKDLGRGSSANVSDLPFLADDQDRGTACCVDVALGTNKTVMVGISHVKLHRRQNYWTHDQLHRYDNATYRYGWNRYLSRFLAYEKVPPFAIVAKSGWFCLGFGGIDENSLAGRNLQYSLDLFDDVFNCPAIHFPSGISETVDDPDKAIIAYGINDCYPRMIVVNKSEIRKRLYPGDR